MSRKSFLFSNKDNIVLSFFEGVSCIICIAYSLSEARHAKGREESCRTACGKYVIRTCIIVAQRLGGIISEEYLTGVVETSQQLHRILHKYLKMLGSYLICQFYAFFTAVRNNDCAVIVKRLLDYFLT